MCLHALADHPEINISIVLCKITINIIQTLPNQNVKHFNNVGKLIFLQCYVKAALLLFKQTVLRQRAQKWRKTEIR